MAVSARRNPLLTLGKYAAILFYLGFAMASGTLRGVKVRTAYLVGQGRSADAPSYANACNEQLFTPEIHRPNNAQQEETTLDSPFPASSMLQAIA